MIQKFTRFVISGGSAALSNFLIYYFFLNILDIWYLVASIMAFILSVFVGFYMQKYFTFRDSSKSDFKSQIIMFFLVSFGNLFINVVLMLFFVETLHIDEVLSKVLTLGILACWNFFVYQKFVFAKTKPISE